MTVGDGMTVGGGMTVGDGMTDMRAQAPKAPLSQKGGWRDYPHRLPSAIVIPPSPVISAFPGILSPAFPQFGVYRGSGFRPAPE